MESIRVPWIVVALMACGHARPVAVEPVAPPPPPPPPKLAVMPAESDLFPQAAETLSLALRQATVPGVDRARVSRVSLEVVQLSIECVDSAPTCYRAVGRSLAVNRLLFAEISAGATKRTLKVTITLFDVDTSRAVKTTDREFASAKEATAGIPELVAEATQP